MPSSKKAGALLLDLHHEYESLRAAFFLAFEDEREDLKFRALTLIDFVVSQRTLGKISPEDASYYKGLFGSLL